VIAADLCVSAVAPPRNGAFHQTATVSPLRGTAL